MKGQLSLSERNNGFASNLIKSEGIGFIELAR